jgi:hypothetical protein
MSYQWVPIGGQGNWAHGWKGQGKGKGPYPPNTQGAKGKGTGKGQPGKGAKPPRTTEWANTNNRQDNRVDKQLQALKHKFEAMEQKFKSGKGKGTKADNKTEPPTATVAEGATTPPTDVPSKPHMFTSKGAQVEVAWSCLHCSQAHWSAKVKNCVNCKKPCTGWAKVPPQPQPPKKVSTAMGPFKNKGLLTTFHRMGLLLDEDTPDGEGEAMDVEEDTLHAKRCKAAESLQGLLDTQANPDLVLMAQAQLDAIPRPPQAKASQDTWDMSRLHRTQGQLMDVHTTQTAAAQAQLAELQTQAANIQLQIEAQLATIQFQQQQFDKFHQAIQSAMAATHAGGPGANGGHPVDQAPTPTQVTSAVLAKQLSKAEHAQSKDQMDAQALKFGVDFTTLMGIMRFAYSGAVIGSAGDDEQEASTAAAAVAASLHAAVGTPVP